MATIKVITNERQAASIRIKLLKKYLMEKVLCKNVLEIHNLHLNDIEDYVSHLIRNVRSFVEMSRQEVTARAYDRYDANCCCFSYQIKNLLPSSLWSQHHSSLLN